MLPIWTSNLALLLPMTRLQLMDLPASPLVIERRVAFSETDASGLIHFTTYFTFMEAAEAELFRQLGITLLQKADGLISGFPRVDCQCQFRRPVGFEDVLKIEMRIEKLEAMRIHYGFTFTGPKGKTCAVGTMVTAYVHGDDSLRLRAAPMPGEVLNLLKTWKNQAT